MLQPRNTWTDKNAYDTQARDLARRFNENFKKYESGVTEAVRAVAPCDYQAASSCASHYVVGETAYPS